MSDEPRKKRRRMDVNTWILLALTLVALAIAFARRPSLAGEGLLAGGKLLRGVAPELLLGFALAGLVEVLIPSATLVRWMGEGSSGRGILIGWLVGLALPGGPYVFFPVVAALFRQGAAPAAVLTLLTAKTLVSPIRMLTYEAPVLGWPLTFARLVPGILLPPLVGWLGGVLYKAFTRTPG
jgi:uncharacterized membrane protein YraQ (UPF0718 family)